MYHTLSPLSTPSIGYPPRRCQVLIHCSPLRYQAPPTDHAICQAPSAARFSAANLAVRCPISAAVKSPSAAHLSAAISALPAGIEGQTFAVAAGAAALALVVRCFCATGAAAMSFHSSHRQQNTPPDWRGILFTDPFYLSLTSFSPPASEPASTGSRDPATEGWPPRPGGYTPPRPCGSPPAPARPRR